VLDHDRIFRVNDPRNRAATPAVAAPVQSGNQTLEKVSLLLNGAGGDPGNPILAGLALRDIIPLATGDHLTGLFVFTDRADPKANLVGQVSGGPAGLKIFDLVLVDGQVAVGSPATGAIRNYIQQDSISGTFLRTFWVQSKDFRTVQLNGLPALDPSDLSPVQITVQQINTSDPFIDVLSDFFVSWADEFSVEHRAENANLDPGFAKAYGGVKFVSVFDTNPTPAVEGVGVEVSAFTELLISQQTKVLVQNTTGLKRFTFRFRAKQGSPYFVDCPVEVLVVAKDPCTCDPPTEEDPPPEEDEPCVEPPVDYIPPLDPPSLTPPDTVWSDPGGGLPIVPYSIEGVTPEQGIVTTFLKEPQLTVTIQAQSVGTNPVIKVRRYVFTGDAAAHDSVKLVFLSEKTYIPLVVDGASCPTHSTPYNPAQALRIAFSRTQEILDGVVQFIVWVEDDGLASKPSAIFGPALANLSAFMQPGTGKTAPTAPT